MRFLEVNVQYIIGISQYSHNIAAVFLVDYLRNQILMRDKCAVYYRNITVFSQYSCSILSRLLEESNKYKILMRFLEVNVQYIGISQYSHNIAAVFLVDYLRNQIRFLQDSYEIP